MYRARIIDSSEDLDLYAQRYAQRAGHGVDRAYLAGARVRALFDGDGELVGGYVVNCRRPFRYLAAVCDQDRPHVLPDADDTCEITCFWMEKRVPAAARMLLYVYMAIDARASGKTWYLGGAAHPSIANHYAMAGCDLAYEGTGEIGGETFPIWLYVANSSHVAGALWRLAGRFLLGRRRRARRVRLETPAAV